MTAAPPVAVDLVADFVCPWCWLGWRNWVKAQKLAPEIRAETTWRPHELDPTVPKQGKPYKDYMRARFAGADADRYKQMREYLEAAAPEAGIAFRFDEIEIRPNTLAAHRLMRWARGQGAETADAVAEGLFAAYFRDLKDIGDAQILAQIGGAAGMDPGVIADLLATDRDEKDVRDEIAFFRRLGVTGVPTYIFGGRFAVPGAAAPDALAEALKEATAKD
ncbi:MAG: DsbA family oxidoreductase [Maricaulaceae bacterium]|nr:DsbA family oxidoreductase [Maricaulaceae bacterium]